MQEKRLKKILKKSITLIAAMILPLAWICCTSLQQKSNDIDFDLIFPVFPDPVDDNGLCVLEFDENKDCVIMPLWYFKSITRYVAYVDEVEKVYAAYKGD